MDKKVVNAINSLKPTKKDASDNVEKVLKELATNTSVKKYLNKIILSALNMIKSNPQIKKDDSTQLEILVQLKLLNDNIQNLNTNFSNFIENANKGTE